MSRLREQYENEIKDAMCGKSDGKTTEMSVLTETKDLEAVIEYVRNLS